MSTRLRCSPPTPRGRRLRLVKNSLCAQPCYRLQLLPPCCSQYSHTARSGWLHMLLTSPSQPGVSDKSKTYKSRCSRSRQVPLVTVFPSNSSHRPLLSNRIPNRDIHPLTSDFPASTVPAARQYKSPPATRKKWSRQFAWTPLNALSGYRRPKPS